MKRGNDQSWSSSSLRIISLTSRSPPASLLTLRGLRVTSASALSITDPGLLGTSGFLDGLPSELPEDGAGISSHASPPMVSCFKKKGHSFASIASESAASAEDIGTGDDLTMAGFTSDMGSARRLRTVEDEVDPSAGVEKILYEKNQQMLFPVEIEEY